MRRVRQATVCAVLVFVAIDLYQFKFAYLFDRSDGIGPEELYVVDPSPMPYPQRRVLDLHQARAEAQSRLVGTIGFNRPLRELFDGRAQNGTQYWTSNAFWFVDEINRRFRRTRGSRRSISLRGCFGAAEGVDFPAERETAARLAGMRADKIRFFAHAYSVPSPEDLNRLVTDRAYKGDLLFVSLPEGDGAADDDRAVEIATIIVGRRLATPSVSRGTLRRQQPHRPCVQHRTDASVDVLLRRLASVVARDGQRRGPAVYRANVAYKAVRLEPGENVVHFRFQSRLMAVLSALAAVNAGVWLIGTGAMMVGVLRSASSPPVGTSAEIS